MGSADEEPGTGEAHPDRPLTPAHPSGGPEAPGGGADDEGAVDGPVDEDGEESFPASDPPAHY